MSFEPTAFIVGCPRSGTTLLAVLLDRHSRLAITPETAFYDEIAPRLADESGALRELLAHWRRLPELAIDADAMIATPEPRERGDVLRRLLELYALRRRKAYVGEKTPQHLRHVPAILADFPAATIFCVTRDGRDAALSLAAMSWWNGGLMEGASAWLEAEVQREQLENRYPGRFCSVSYEVLVRSPERALCRIMSRIGLGFEPAQLVPTPSPVVLARSLEWKGDALAEVQPGLAHRRRTAASPPELAALEARLAPALARRRTSLASAW